MKRRILAWALALALVLCLLPAGALPAFAAEGMPELTNLKYNEGVISWDPYPGASHYYYVIGDYVYTGWTTDGKSELDIMQRLKNSYAPSDTYAVRIYANDDDYNEIACSEITCIYYGLERHPAPANLRWDGYTARWDPVEGAGNGYVIYVFRSDTDSYVYSTQTNETYFNAANYLHYQDWNYCFMVKVCGSESGAESEYAKCPTSIPGRFTLGDLTLSLNGDRLSWPPYVDTEGNEAYRYYICEGYSNPQNLGYYFYGTGVNLRKLLELKDAPGGTYEYSLVAECRSGLEVSNESNTVTYEYTPEARTVATMTQYESRGGSLSGLCLYGLQISNYRNYSCTVGAEIPVLIIPWEHYVADKLLVCYGGEEHEGGELTRQANGTYIGSFTVPNEDFTLTVEMDYDYVDLHSVSATFSTAPGQNVYDIDVNADENTNAYRGMAFNSNHQICYSEFLLPGDEIRQIVKFYTREGYQRFAEDVTAEINGQSAEVLYRSEDGGTLYCAYDFTVPDESFTIKQPSSWDPIPNLSVSDSGVITWDPYPGAAMYYVGGSDVFYSDPVTDCSFDLAGILRDNRAPSGWYVIEVQAETEEWSTLTYSRIAWYYDGGAEQLAAPTNLRWDGNTAKWDPVEGAASYHVRIIEYPYGTYETDRYSTTNSYDFGDYLQDKNRQYVFRVSASSDDGRADSPWSPISAPRNGRFIRGPLNVTLDGDTLRWEEYVDTEGNPAAKYCLYQYEGPTYLYYDTYVGTSVNLRDVLELINASDGEYKFDVTAYAKDGSSVSLDSDEVIYNYTANPRTTVKLDGYQCELGYYMDMARINGMTLPRYETLTVTAGKLYTLTLRPEEHYVLEDVAMRYAGEDHYDAINLEQKSDGTYTCRFRAPDQDYKLFFKTQWDWVDLSEAQITFSEAPGTRTDYYYLNEPEWPCDAYVKDTVSNDRYSIYGSEYLLPGQRWLVTLLVRPKQQWERFSEDPTITINGKKAEIVKRREDGRELYVRYEFEVADAAAVELEPYYEDQPALENVKVSAEGVVTWDAFPGAVQYYVYSDDNYNNEMQDACSFDLRAGLEDWKAPSGWYKCIICAKNDANENIAYGATAWYYNNGAERLATPTNLRWDGYTARWDPVEGATGYYIQVAELGESYSVLTTSVNDTSYDLTSTMFYWENVYAFRVYAYGDDLAKSSWTALTEGKRGRFRLDDMTISLDGDILSWPEYIDTEGNPADCYYIYQYGNPEVFNSTYYGTSLDLRQALEMKNAPDGDYTFMVYAEEIAGGQISKYSNDIVYHYEDQPRSTVKAKIDKDWDCSVFVNRICAYDGDEYALTVGKEVTLEIRPDARYRAKEAFLVFGEDDRQEIPLTEDADRISTGSFTVPNKNFTIYIRSERFYEKLHSLSADFCEDPGYLLALIGITPEGVDDWRAQISGLTGPHGAGNANLRPGAEYEADIDFYIQSDVYRFADDVTVKINGHTCTPESVDGSHVRVRYTFTVSSELKSVIVRGVTAPVLEAKPEVGQGVPGGVYYSIVNESEVSKRWYYYEDGWKWMAEDEEFRPDISYILQLEYAPTEGCTWADDLKVKVEDVDPVRIESISVLPSGEPEGANRTVEIHFKPLSAPKPLESAGCTIDPPVEGGHPDMNPVVLDAEKYTVTLTGWYWDMQPGVKMTSASTFSSGGRYCLRVWFEPKEGYYFTEDTVFTVNGKPFDSRYGFEQGQVQIDLVAAEEKPDNPTEGPFVDVAKGKFYYDAVNWAVEHDPVITNGINATHFGPDNACTRGHVVTFLWRAAGCPEPSGAESPFTDLKPGAFYEKAVAWAVEQGITNGTSATTFSPDAACNRGQIVTFLWRYKGGAEPAGTADVFTDLKPGAFYEKAVAWAVENNITNGMTPTTFGPNNTCTRGQVVTFLYRADKA